jgi:hypothetical protein
MMKIFQRLKRMSIIGFVVIFFSAGSVIYSLDISQKMNHAKTKELLNDFKNYITQNVNVHAGNLYEHSLWTAITVVQWWQEKNAWIEGINAKFKDLTIMASLFHDIGKAGDLKYLYKEKENHPYFGLEYIAGYRDYHVVKNLINPFDFKSYCADLGFQERDQKILAILVGVHWEFGGIVLKGIADLEKNGKATPEEKNKVFARYLMILQDLAFDVSYNNGIIDDQLLRMAILITAADVKGAKGNYYPNSIIVEAPQEPHPAKKDAYSAYAYETQGIVLRNELLHYFEDVWKPGQKPSERLISVRSYKPGELRSQTEALLEQNFVQSRMRFMYKDAIIKNKTLIEDMIKKERQLMGSYYVFYHGLAKYYYVIHAAIKEMISLMYPWSISLAEFHTVRVPRAPMFDQYQTIEDFLNKQISTYGGVHDSPAEKAKQLAVQYKKYGAEKVKKMIAEKVDKSVPSYIVSVNLALFGNIGLETKSECTFDFFVKDKERSISNKYSDRIWFYDMLLRSLPMQQADDFYKDLYGKSFIRECAKKLLKISDAMRKKVKEGVIYQIFVPKNMVDSVGYLARNYGQPYGNLIAFNYLFNREVDKEQRMNLFWELLDKDPEKALEGSKDDLLSSVLNLYQHDPKKLHNINRLQARLLYSNSLLLNPSSKVKTFVYSTMSSDEKKDFEQQIKNAVHKCFTRFLKYNSKVSEPDAKK